MRVISNFNVRRFILCRAFAVIAGLCLAGILATPAPARSDDLAKAVDVLLNQPALNGGITGAVVENVDTAQIVYARNPLTRLAPASNRKLFTSAAALALLGDDFQLTTRVVAAGHPDAAGSIAGDIYLRGAGDAFLSPSDLEQLGRQMVAEGVKRIDGRVVGDGGLFTDGPYAQGWEWDDLPYSYAPQISGLEVSRGVLAVHVSAGPKLGAPVTVTVDQPTAYLPIVNTATTVASGGAAACEIRRPWNANVLMVSGTLPAGGKQDGVVTVEDPAAYAATVFTETLGRLGVIVSGAAQTGRTPETAAVVLAAHRSLPMAQYIALMNKPSDNLAAESLVRVIGAAKNGSGAYRAGHAAEMEFFGSVGLDPAQIDLLDGSGLARSDMTTPLAIVKLLVAMHARPDWPAYCASLPIAGVDGALRNRMKATAAAGNVHAKTGSLRGVSSLSGYFTGKTGAVYAFSLLMNDFSGSESAARAIQDQFAEFLVSSL